MPPRRRATATAEKVTLKLAHPLNDGNPFTGTEEKVGAEVTLPRDRASALIGSGYAQVDPYDPVAVAEALGDRVVTDAPPGGDG